MFFLTTEANTLRKSVPTDKQAKCLSWKRKNGDLRRNL